MGEPVTIERTGVKDAIICCRGLNWAGQNQTNSREDEGMVEKKKLEKGSEVSS